MTEKGDKKGFSRRKFLQRGAIVLGGTVVTVFLGRGPIRRFAAQKIEALDVPSLISTYDPDFWFEIAEDNTVVLRSPKVEMGQGIFTGFALLAAEELYVAPQQIRVEHASTANGPVDKISTGGSNSTSSLFTAIREVAATLCAMLREAAARQWGIDPLDITVGNGMLMAGTRQATYAEIARSTREWPKPRKPHLKPRKAFAYIGRDVKRTDLAPKVLGEPLFGIDAVRPGMLYAVTLQSPFIGGVLQSVDTAEAALSAGVVRVVREEDLVAVVADSRFAAEMALLKIGAKWEVPRKWQQEEIEAMVTVGNGTAVAVQKKGSARSVLAGSEAGGRLYRQEYRTPMAAHAQMEPNGTVADVGPDQATIIIGTQAPALVRDTVAKALGMKKDKVVVEPAYPGGGFGRRMHVNNAVTAARLSRIVGKPVHVFNTREQEFQNSLYRPNTHHVLQAKIAADGVITAISHDVATPDMTLRAIAGELAVTLAGADFISAGHGAGIMYNVANRATTIWNSDVPVPTGIWRSVGMFANTFAIETFVNELAHQTGQDPIALRRELLSGPDTINKRYEQVLDTLAGKSGWKTPKPAGAGRGMAIGNDRKSIAAAAVEVTITGGRIRVTRVTHVLDVGLAVNPEGIRMQVEGCIMMGISAALYEELTVADGQIAATNYHEYPMASLADTPAIEAIILEGDDQPYGVGEPPIAPIAPAIAAAVFDLTGTWLRSLPLRLEGLTD